MTNEVPTLTRDIATLCLDYQFERLPEDVIKIARLCILDNLGCAVRGAREHPAQIMGAELFGKAVQGKDLLPSALSGARAVDRAMLHGVAAHAIDFDDTYVPAKAAHAGNAVVGSAIALLNEVNVSEKEFLTAIVAGYEVAARVAALLDDTHYLKGFHPTATVGVFASAATSARLLKLDTNQVCSTFGLAATQASGLKCTFGTMAKPFNAGNAASSGLLAAKLVSAGFTAPENAIEAEKGYLDMFMGLPAPEREIADIDDYRIRGNLFKFYAACHATHPLIEGISRLQGQNQFSTEELTRVEIGVSELSLKTASITKPSTGLETKFSFNQVAACTLAGLNMAADSTYTESVLENAEITRLRNITSVSVNTEFTPADISIQMFLRSGEVLKMTHHAFAQEASIASQEPQLREKFLSNVAHAIETGEANRLYNSVSKLGSVGGKSVLAALTL